MMSSGNLATIKRVLEEHQLLAKEATRVRERINDLEAVFALDQASAKWGQAAVDAVEQKRQALANEINVMAAGVGKHFDFEEGSLPSILGETLMKALVKEHLEIRRKNAECANALAWAKLEGLQQEKALSRKAEVLQLIVDARHAMADHVGREEVVLKMAERGLL